MSIPPQELEKALQTVLEPVVAEIRAIDDVIAQLGERQNLILEQQSALLQGLAEALGGDRPDDAGQEAGGVS